MTRRASRPFRPVLGPSFNALEPRRPPADVTGTAAQADTSLPTDPQLVGWTGGDTPLPADLAAAAGSLAATVVHELASDFLGYLTFGQSGCADPVTGLEYISGP